MLEAQEVSVQFGSVPQIINNLLQEYKLKKEIMESLEKEEQKEIANKKLNNQVVAIIKEEFMTFKNIAI